jgi:hypothetical protein
MSATAGLSGTRTATSTMTLARVRHVMVEVRADFFNIAMSGLWSSDSAAKLATDLTYLLEKEVVKSFQIQFSCDGQLSRALEYVVNADGSLQTANRAGGIDYLALAQGTRAKLFVDIDFQSPQIETAKAYLTQKGWSFNGAAVTGVGTRDRVYSTEGYGVTRTKVGSW